MTVYHSKIDWWLATLTLGSIGVPLVWGALELQQPGHVGLILILVAAICASPLALVFPCRYTLADEHLEIKAGILVNEKVMYSDIESAEKSSDPTSAPALSLKRVAIRTPRKVFLVSPKDRDEFIMRVGEKIGAKDPAGTTA